MATSLKSFQRFLRGNKLPPTLCELRKEAEGVLRAHGGACGSEQALLSRACGGARKVSPVMVRHAWI